MKVEEIGSHGPGSFADLPMEIILKIFRYLNFGDIKFACLVCRRWFDASQDSEFQSNVLLKFAKTHLSDDSFPGSVFLNTFRSFPHLYLHKITLGVVNNFFTHIGPTVGHIVFDKVDMTEEQFKAILKKITNIKALTIIGPLFTEVQFFKSEAGQEFLAASLINIREITIKDNWHLKDAILHLSTSLPPNLERITIDSVSSFKILLNIIENNVGILKELHLRNNQEDDNFSSLANIKGLDLRKLGLEGCSTLKFTGLETFLKTQKNLVALNLSNTTISDSCVELIYNHLTELEVLNLALHGEISSANMGRISLLKRLKVLGISFCNLSSDDIQQGFATAKNYSLLELYMCANSQLSEDSLIQCTENFPNLRVFEISFCEVGVTDKVVQAIIKNLRWLRLLNLNECSLITDAALTGISVKTQFSNEAASHLVEGHEMNHRNDRNGLSIKELKGLKTLQLQGCYKITDESLKYGLQFLELKKLELCRCQQISVTGIQALVENCPSIEELNLSLCRNINKKCIEVISQRLHRLQSLDISGCDQLIDHLDYVVNNCKAVRVLTFDTLNRNRAIQKIQQSVKISRNLCIQDYSDNLAEFFISSSDSSLALLHGNVL